MMMMLMLLIDVVVVEVTNDSSDETSWSDWSLKVFEQRNHTSTNFGDRCAFVDAERLHLVLVFVLVLVLVVVLFGFLGFVFQ